MKKSAIKWTESTFNYCSGCTKIGPGCEHCYAANIAGRFKTVSWGPGQPRVLASETYREQPFKWNADAERDGVRRRVFAASMSDVFDREVPNLWRTELFEIISRTSSLDWLVLTKRINEAEKWSETIGRLPNIWLGASTEDQVTADRRIPVLSRLPARVRFLSIEPLLGPLVLGQHLAGLDWVIVGGESGPRFRAMNPDWVRALRDECVAAHVPFFFKQFSGRHPHALGRVLDGREWNDFPTPRSCAVPANQNSNLKIKEV